ncbi:hypothetical protein K493DRAFT_319152 [Basidiobolus meristosporus CBS 931.73]|uniref:Queuosine 5'-phosphate N-glycosylase/hydrolase n=1 Tax=Basidiobolus meristosporus CBS 931.73 TaxID=1314790 RepID=A0A1Y1XSZ1_9FUNG|nr:hypothetical protein K493DRAFT_319152 [Basidiobolus meristosporus CBS 931.73]|eukprot:ORX88879.1 hypothetical protein K493DRAFT_319152 [Basidiobolus meristosporus CBS 931.73]
MKTSEYSTATWKTHPLNPKVANEQAIDWIFLVDSLNFSFWSEYDSADQYAVSYEGNTYRGYWTLCCSINRAISEGVSITDPRVFKDITEEQLSYIFRSDTKEPIPLLSERLAILHEVGTVLVEKFGGSFVNCIKQAEKSAMKLLHIIVDNFNSYRDEHLFRGRKVQIYKRAQILIADIWACFEGQGLGEFMDIDEITMFADYRVPQALVHFNALEYSSDLLALLRSNTIIPSGDRLEVEIRGCSIWAVECLRREIQTLMDQFPNQSKYRKVNPILIDFYVWDYAKAYPEQLKDIPIHLTRSLYY